jgi:hypothetical protein
MATVKKSMKKAAPKKAMAAPMQAPPMGAPMMKKGGKMAKAQNGKEIAEFLAKRKAAAPATPKYDRNEAMSQMNAASKGYDAAKDKASRDSASAAYEPIREAGMKSMGYSKNPGGKYKAGGKLAKAMKVVKAVKAVKKAIKSK